MNDKQLFKHAKRIAHEAGEIILQHYQDDELTINTKADDSPVTEADKAADTFIRDALEELTDYAVITEESPPPSKETRRMWIVDPIDGTKEFINGTDDFAVHIALVEDGEPIIGIVHAPAHKKTYSAQKGAGAYRDQTRISCSSTSTLKDAQLVVTRSERPKHYHKHLDALPHSSQIPTGGYGLRICRVAEGTADVHPAICATPRSWDSAAPAIIILEAGGRISTPDGRPLTYALATAHDKHKTIASNKKLHADYLRHAKDYA